MGVDGVYLGMHDATNARNLAGLNFDEASIAAGTRYAHARGATVLSRRHACATRFPRREWF